MQGYKTLLSYKLAKVVFDLAWELVPFIYPAYEDSRQRSQIKQAARSLKQNLVEGSEERSLSSKLKLFDVARASLGELLEDCEDVLRHKGLACWSKNDPRLVKLRAELEGYRPLYSHPSGSSVPSGSPPTRVTIGDILQVAGGTRRTKETRRNRLTEEELEIVINYLIDVLIRCGYLLDRQIDAVEEKHRTEGGYKENLYRKRKEYRGY